ncbi:MAG: adenylate/guanylate cyclase domain-containing protein, partial [Gammaproteobacteria bacterium]
MDLLVYMSQRPGEVLTREEMEENVWQGMVIGYDALTNAIIKLRKAFDDSARNPTIIETLPKKGYRLIAELSFPESSDNSVRHQNIERKLTAILYADVVGYSRLTEQDEEGTHQLVSAYLDAISQAIVHHNGNVVHYAGDAVLADFATVIDAVSCAADIQRDLAARNARQAADQVVQFRIGINLGDVIVDRDDIYGEGVNVAARLESLADPGGICISESVRSTVGHKLPFSYEFLGEQMVKNIAEPIRAYRVLLSPEAGKAIPQKVMHRWRTLLGIILLVVVVISATWIVRDMWLIVPPVVGPAAPALPDKPSIAVLPFVNTGNEAEHAYFSDGITDDLITDLSNISGLFVISRNSTFRYKGRAVDAKQVASTLGVRYLLEGSVRRSGDRVRINTQLIDGTTGGQIWARRYDGSLQNVFELQDQVTTQIITALALQLTPRDEAQRAIFETTNVAAYDEFLKGWEQYRHFTRESFSRAEMHFRNVLELDPNYSRAHAALALVYWQTSQNKWHENRGTTQTGWARARLELDKSMANPTPLAHSLMSAMFLYNRRYEEAITEAQRAIDLNTNNPAGYLALANAMGFAGQSIGAVEVVKKAIRLDPNYSAPYLSVLGRVQYDLGDFDEAIDNLERSVLGNPRDRKPLITLIAAYGQLGQLDKAVSAFDQLNNQLQTENKRTLTIDWIKYLFPYREKLVREHLLEGLRK